MKNAQTLAKDIFLIFPKNDSEQVEIEEVIPSASLSYEQVEIEKTILSSNSTSFSNIKEYEVQNSNANDGKVVDEESK